MPSMKSHSELWSDVALAPVSWRDVQAAAKKKKEKKPHN
jgi:hypothetical protein